MVCNRDTEEVRSSLLNLEIKTWEHPGIWAGIRTEQCSCANTVCWYLPVKRTQRDRKEQGMKTWNFPDVQ